MPVLVQVFVGSSSDHKTIEESGMLDALDRLIGPDNWELHDASAHRNPVEVATWVPEMVDDGAQVLVGVAGMTNHLAGALATHTRGRKVVIGLALTPGTESSITEMPGLRPIILVGTGSSALKKAAEVIAQILAIGDADIDSRLDIYMTEEEAKKPAKRGVILLPKPLSTGKVRSTYYGGDRDHLVQVSSDGISVFDVPLTEPDGKRIMIPGKGKVLTGLTRFWLQDIFPHVNNHLVTTDVSHFPRRVQALPDIAGRAALVRKCQMLHVEFIFRAFMYGSGWREYRKSGTIGGMPFRDGYKEADRLDEVLLTPSTKAAAGFHDENITPDLARQAIVNQGFPPELYDEAEEIAKHVFTCGAVHLAERDITLADTKLEFGVSTHDDGSTDLVLCDEVLTPDSSRFWDKAAYEAGGEGALKVVQYDKEIARRYYHDNHPEWAADPKPPSPPLPKGVRQELAEGYERMLVTIMGPSLAV